MGQQLLSQPSNHIICLHSSNEEDEGELKNDLNQAVEVTSKITEMLSLQDSKMVPQSNIQLSSSSPSSSSTLMEILKTKYPSDYPSCLSIDLAKVSGLDWIRLDLMLNLCLVLNSSHMLISMNE